MKKVADKSIMTRFAKKKRVVSKKCRRGYSQTQKTLRMDDGAI
jgi:hypothetical protein